MSPAPSDHIDAVLYLIGDAGLPAPREPVLAALRRDAAGEASRRPAGSVVIAFLGDNLYPDGLHDSLRPSYRRDTTRLNTLIDLVGAARVPGYFLPGNHDWASGAPSGWDAIQRQTEYVARRHPESAVLPGRGCPGPDVRDVGARLRLVFLDTHWWLHDHAKPDDALDGCGSLFTATAVLDSLTRVLRSGRSRDVVVLGHHPLATGGRHGAYPLRTYVFPQERAGGPLGDVPIPPGLVLDALIHLLALPFGGIPIGVWDLPVVASGALVPVIAGYRDQDLPHPRYREMRDSLARAFAVAPPLVYAAGHDHNLQVIQGEVAAYILISGAGSRRKITRGGPTAGSVYWKSQPGYMRLDFLTDGRTRLGVFITTDQGEAEEVFSRYLER